MNGKELADAIWKSLQNFDAMKQERPKYVYLDIGQICDLNKTDETEFHTEPYEHRTIHGLIICEAGDEEVLYFSDQVYEMRT